MANWTVSSYSNSETTGDNVSAGSMAAYADLTITPNVGYVISATDFKIGGATESPTNTWTGGNIDSEIYKVVFSDIGTAGTVANTVKARVHFAAAATGGSSWNMPSNNDTLYIDIDEKVTVANIDRYVCIRSHHYARTDGNGVNKHTVTYATAPTDITTTNNTPLTHNLGDGLVEHSHEGTVAEGPTAPGAQVFQVTFATNTTFGYYYVNAPTATIAVGSYSSYWQVIDSSPTYTSMTTGGITSNELTSITYTVYYTPPVGVVGLDPDPASSAGAMCELGQVITFDDLIRLEDQGEPGSVPQITSVVVDTSNILSTGETRNINIYGDNAAEFYLKIVSSDSSKTYDFGPTGSGANGTFTATATTSVANTMGTNGNTQYPVDFPATSSNLTYDIIITPIAPTGVAVGVPIVANDLRLYQYARVVVTLGILDGGGEYDDGELLDGSPNTAITITGEAGTALAKGLSNTFSYTINESMVTTIGSDSLVAKTSPDFILDNQGTVITLTDGAPSSATFDVDSTTGIVATNTINWETQKIPLFGLDVTVREIAVGKYDPDLDDQVPGSSITDLTVGMLLSASNISSSTVTITSISADMITLSESIAVSASIPITFTADGVTVSSVTDGDTIVASQSLSGLTDNLSLTFGGGESDTSAYVVNGTSTQSGDNVILAGTFIVDSFPIANKTVKIDLDKLITLE